MATVQVYTKAGADAADEGGAGGAGATDAGVASFVTDGPLTGAALSAAIGSGVSAAAPLWSGLGMNIGNTFNFSATYPTAQVTADLATLKSAGFTKLRVALPHYTDGGGITNMQTLALAAKAAGFYVTYGLAASALTSTNLSGAYQTAVYAQAAWAKANGIDEFQVGNEMENYIDGSLTEQQIRTWVRGAATAIKATGYTGKVSYAVGQGYSNKSAGWVSNPGLGGLDYLGINAYGDDPINSSLGFEYYIDQLLTVYTKAQLYVSEFNIYHSWPAVTLSDREILDQVGQRLAAVRARVDRADFFTWRFLNNDFSAKRADGTYAPFWSLLTGRDIWARPSTAVRKQFGIQGVTTGTNNTQTANTVYLAQTHVTNPTFLTGLSFYNGGTISGNVRVGLYTAAGVLVAQSGSVAHAGMWGLQSVPFTTPYLAASGFYFIAMMPSSSTATFALCCAQVPSTAPGQGSFVLPATIAPPTGAGAYVIDARTY